MIHGLLEENNNNNYNCGRNESFPNQVLFALKMNQGADATLTNLFNPTSEKDASHPCLISTWPKEWCTIVCVCGRNESFPNQVLFALEMGRGADATLMNLFNPTSRKNASHPCLINTWPKEGFTIVVIIIEPF